MVHKQIRLRYKVMRRELHIWYYLIGDIFFMDSEKLHFNIIV